MLTIHPVQLRPASRTVLNFTVILSSLVQPESLTDDRPRASFRKPLQEQRRHTFSSFTDF